ncbi:MULTISPECIES: LysE family transporter [unclassified Nocardiopsis]|uniref:LysE family transporter n=2 Tax=Nocardiopsidaceae TaxID=83676 RepID=UPI00387B60DC
MTWWTFTLLVWVSLVVPGPDFVVIAQAALAGTGRGVRTAAGVVAGLCLHSAAAAAGLGALLVSFPGVMGPLRLVGGGVLIWFGISMLRPAATAAPSSTSNPGGTDSTSDTAAPVAPGGTAVSGGRDTSGDTTPPIPRDHGARDDTMAPATSDSTAVSGDTASSPIPGGRTMQSGTAASTTPGNADGTNTAVAPSGLGDRAAPGGTAVSGDRGTSGDTTSPIPGGHRARDDMARPITPAAPGGAAVPVGSGGRGVRGEGRWFLRGLAVNALNPKALLFFAAVVPQFVTASAPVLPRTVLLGATVVVSAALWWALVVTLIRAARFPVGGRAERVATRGGGAVLIVLGAVLAAQAL